MLTVACVNWGDYLHRGNEYVAKLQAMVQRNLREPHQFVCIDNADGLTGWWTKIALFEPGRFKGRVLYSDLDAVITGPLDALANTTGIIDLTDWGWTTPTLCSSVMVWDAGQHSEIFAEYSPRVPLEYEGDQDWMTALGGWAALPAHLCRSYRYHCTAGPPAGCVHASFHGSPKPHEIRTGWVPKAWA